MVLFPNYLYWLFSVTLTPNTRINVRKYKGIVWNSTAEKGKIQELAGIGDSVRYGL